MTRRLTIRALKFWEAFLHNRRVDSDAVTIHDYIAWTSLQALNGFTRTAKIYNIRVRSYYLLKGAKNPDSKWSKLASEIKTYRIPKPTGKRNPYKPLAVALMPKILEAARSMKSEALAIVATFIYTGGRAQYYGLTVDQVQQALDPKHGPYAEIFVKEGEHVYVPVPDQLLPIWRRHLEERDFKGPMFFSKGRDPYTYQAGSKNWREDDWAARSNDLYVARTFHGRARGDGSDCVEKRLEKMFGIDEEITSHRIRKTVASCMKSYGFPDHLIRLQMSHGAETITEFYEVADVLQAQKDLSRMDLGNAEWVAAHDPPRSLFAGNGNGHDEDLVAELIRQRNEARDRMEKAEDRADRFEKKFDELLDELRRLKGGS
jgi:hypothetical protein